VLIERLWPFVLTVVYRRLGGQREPAEDLAQEVFTDLIDAEPFKRLADVDALRAYVWRMADNEARSYLKSLRRRAEESGGRQAMATVASQEPTAEWVLEAREWLEGKLEQMAPVDRELAKLIAEGYRLREAAEAVGLSYTNAGVRLHRLRKRFGPSGRV